MKLHSLTHLGKLTALSLALAGLPMTAVAEPAANEKQKAATIDLFDGKSLEGWSYVLVDKNVKMEDVWSVKDGVLVCKGKPLGYLVTKGSYKNFKLEFEWRWAPGASLPGTRHATVYAALGAEGSI